MLHPDVLDILFEDEALIFINKPAGVVVQQRMHQPDERYLHADVTRHTSPAYLMQRLFRFDALSEHATREEYREIVRRNGSRLYGLGLALAPVYYVPVVNLVAPVFSGLAFTHLCLAELDRLRRSA